MAESNAMSSRILRTIESIIKNDHELQEFTIIPTEDNTKNKSPVLYLEHNLGLESWCIKHVYQYACSVLFEHKLQLSRRKVPYSEMEKLNQFLIGAILINPDVGTFWNMKRELVERDVLKVEDELNFSKIVLSHKSKSNEAFAYRRWLLSRVLDKMATNNLEVPLNILQTEFSVADMASLKSPNNYHSWNHRIWCMENIGSHYNNVSHIVFSELSYSQEWINNHISEHAGYHYRQYLIKLVKEHKKIVTLFESFYNFVVKTLLNTTNDGDCGNLLTYLLGKPNRTRLLEETCSYVNYISILLYDFVVLVDKLNKVFPEHEALFSHRKFLAYHLLKVPCDYHGIEFKTKLDQDKGLHVIDGKNITESDAVINVKSDCESDRWPKLFKVSPSKSEIYNLYGIVSNCEKNFASQNYSVLQLAKYRKWLAHVVGFE
ncbi:unnamed protein product [Psylliodes chrysocephalus]|uniref:Uncharacterized protein n=1 Tax=Psylliodes chrysocephalus TaxID=3402493 RepID=A0A9P0D8R3_9CUCU|nr:unnamed protein product [Psylliodes chrysocephala]